MEKYKPKLIILELIDPDIKEFYLNKIETNLLILKRIHQEVYLFLLKVLWLDMIITTQKLH